MTAVIVAETLKCAGSVEVVREAARHARVTRGQRKMHPGVKCDPSSGQAVAAVDRERRTGDVVVRHQEDDGVRDLLGLGDATGGDGLGH